MSFEEIAQALCITRTGAWMAYRRGMNKLRAKSQAETIAEMRGMATALNASRTFSGEFPVNRGEIRRAKQRGGRV
jgi:hypothetical protein